MLSDEEKNSMELDIEAKYVGRTEKEFLNNVTYAECLYILDTKNKYCDDIKNLSLLKIVDIVNEQSKEIEEYKKQLDLDYVDKHFVPIERYNQLEKEIEELKDKNKKLRDKAKELIFEKQELTSALLDSTPNDKIKAKIEEVEQWELYNMKIPRLSTLDERLGAKIGIKYILQSLLEEE